MRNYYLLLLLLTSLANAQNIFEIEKLPSRVRISGEFINMHNEPDIGFLGHGYEVFGLIPKFKSVYFGVNAYSALTGIRSGFIVFGVSTGIQKSIYKDWFSYDLGLYLGGGGGSGAPDGGGLMIRPHLDFQIDLSKNIALRTGVSGITFPSGAINSFNVNIGAVIKTNTYFVSELNDSQSNYSSNSYFSNMELSASSLNLFNFRKGPLRPDNTGNPSVISLVGLTLKTHQKKSVFGVLKLGGAFTGGVDGFMMLLSGLGYQVPITHWLYLNASALAGGAGGGDVDFGGGLATQIQAGLAFKLKDYYLEVSGGNTYAPNGNFKSNHLDVSLGKTFKMYRNSSSNLKEVVVADEFKEEGFNFSVFNRSYFLDDLELDKNDRNYDAIFNLIGFELSKKVYKKTSLLAATVWAYQGSYGAYAEGWLGLKQTFFSKNNMGLNAKIWIGAGGGGGINLGSGLAYQYSFGIDKKINQRWSLIANAGQVRPVLNGNFTPILLDIGVKLNIHQLVINN
ncbi:hypothetical protein ACXGQW_03910 [Wenyingzhuangia sp. IMCC45533]